jgi:hypothetical protein
MTALSRLGLLKTLSKQRAPQHLEARKNESVLAEKEYMHGGLFMLISKHEILSQLQMRRFWPSGVYAVDALRVLPVGSEASADAERDG